MYTVIINDPENVRMHAETPSYRTAEDIAHLFSSAYVIDENGDVIPESVNGGSAQ